MGVFANGWFVRNLEEEMIGYRGIVCGLMMALVVGGFTLTPQVAMCQTMQELRPGQVVQGSADWEGSAEYSFKAETAGVLTVVARSLNESDLQLLVTDMDGQPLPDGRSDQDLGGDVGAEQFAVTLPRAGGYRVVVETFAGGQASFQLGVSWISLPGPGGSRGSRRIPEFGPTDLGGPGGSPEFHRRCFRGLLGLVRPEGG